MAFFGMLHCVALVRTDVSEELSSSFISVTSIGELETTLAVTANRRSVRRWLVTANVPSSPILVTLMKEALSSSETSFLQEPHCVTSKKTPFFTVTALKTSNLTHFSLGVERLQRTMEVQFPTKILGYLKAPAEVHKRHCRRRI
jgi:hypothetical protein